MDQLAAVFYADPRPSFYILVGLITGTAVLFTLLSLKYRGVHDAL
jgi:hypothetical protein